MNRVIKFRGWHKALNKMLYSPNSMDSMVSVRDSKGEHVTIESFKGCYSYYPATMSWDGRQYIDGVYQDIEWMQYTGLNDKNGKEIYEGDFLKGIERPVMFWDGCFYIGIDYDCIDIPLYEANFNEIEVYGNTFENPELYK